MDSRELSRIRPIVPSLIVDRICETGDAAPRCRANRPNHRLERVLITKPDIDGRHARTHETEGADTMSTLVAVVFNDEHTAFDMRAELARMQKEHLIELEDAVVVTRDQKGKTKLDQAVNLTSAGARRRRVLGHADRADLPQSSPRLCARRGCRRAVRQVHRHWPGRQDDEGPRTVVQARLFRRSSCSCERRRPTKCCRA